MSAIALKKQERGPWSLLSLVGLFLAWGAGRSLAGADFSAQNMRELRGEAYIGQPFGVGSVDVPIRAEELGLAGPFAISLRDGSGRVFYPAVDFPRGQVFINTASELLRRSDRPTAQLAADLLARLPRIKIYFLFRGADPLELTISGPLNGKVVLKPESHPRRWARHLSDWWEAFCEWDRPITPGLPEESLLGQFMPYLEKMLAQRLELRRLERPRDAEDEWTTWLREGEELLSGPRLGPLLRLAWDERLPFRPQESTVELPAVDWDEGTVAAAEEEVPAEIEPIAYRVPQVCCYVRFGNYPNFLWFQDFVARIGGDWEHLFRLRRQQNQLSQEIERTLALRQSVLARTLAPFVVEDVALVLGDFALAEGGTFGILFKARNDAVLGADLRRQRAELLASDPSITETLVEIAGRTVSLLTSADGAVRSFYCADGGFHFVTRSRRLMELFLATGDAGKSLARSVHFRKLRQLMPPQKDDTVFLYAGPEFWTVFFHPQVQIELFRRSQALADIRMVELARLAASAEGISDQSLQTLVTAGFLPPDFGPRADGSMTVLRDGKVVDSKRGRAGAFVPVWDVLHDRACPKELAIYSARRRYLEGKLRWANCPVAVSLAWRSKGTEGPDQDRMHFRVCILPERGRTFPFMENFGPPLGGIITPLPGDGFFAEFSLDGEHRFVGLREIRLPRLLGGEAAGLFPLRDLLVAYWGLAKPDGRHGQGTGGEGSAYSPAPQPRRNLAQFLPEAPPAMPGIRRGLLGIWEIETPDYRASSFHPEVLADLFRHWQWEKAETEALARVFIADLSGRPVEAGFKRLAWLRAVGVTANHLRFLHWFGEQFRLEPGAAKSRATEILGAELACPFGGKYAWKEGMWYSTRIGSEDSRSWLWGFEALERDFAAPPLDWFRGAKVEITRDLALWLTGWVGMEFAGKEQSN